MCAYPIYWQVHVHSVNETRQGKAATPKDNFFFVKRKNELPAYVAHQVMYMVLCTCVLVLP